MAREVFSSGAFDHRKPIAGRRRNRPFSYRGALKRPISEADIERVGEATDKRDEKLRQIFFSRLDELGKTLGIKSKDKDSSDYWREFAGLLAMRHVPGLKILEERTAPSRRGREAVWNDEALVALLGLVRTKKIRKSLSIESVCKNIKSEDCGDIVPVTTPAAYAKKYYTALRREDLRTAEAYYFRTYGTDWFPMMRDGGLFTEQPIIDPNARRQVEGYKHRLLRTINRS